MLAAKPRNRLINSAAWNEQLYHVVNMEKLAERVGFEPTVRTSVQRFLIPPAERIGFEPTVRVSVQRFSILPTERVGFEPTVRASVMGCHEYRFGVGEIARCLQELGTARHLTAWALPHSKTVIRSMSCGSFAIWFAIFFCVVLDFARTTRQVAVGD